MLHTTSDLLKESRTGGNTHRVSARLYENGELDITTMTLHPEDRIGGRGGHKRKNTEARSMDPRTVAASIARTRTSIHRKCMALGVHTLLTLTFRENVTDVDKAWAVFSYFMKLCKQHGHTFGYVAVWERQKRGAIHFHLAVNKRIEYGKAFKDNVRDCWQRAAGTVGGGNIDVSGGARDVNESRDPRRIIGYLCKYLTKDFQENLQFNRRRYSSSKGIAVPCPEIAFACAGTDMEWLFTDICYALTGRAPKKIVEFKNYFSGFICVGSTHH